MRRLRSLTKITRTNRNGILSSTWKRSKLFDLQLKLGLTPVPKAVKVAKIQACPCCKKGKMVTILSHPSKQARVDKPIEFLASVKLRYRRLCSTGRSCRMSYPKTDSQKISVRAGYDLRHERLVIFDSNEERVYTQFRFYASSDNKKWDVIYDNTKEPRKDRPKCLRRIAQKYKSKIHQV